MRGAATVRVPGGTFDMGGSDFYPEEQPVRPVDVVDLWVDLHPVTNAAFRRFVADTSHVTVAERAPDAADFPDADLELLVPGSQVFTPPPGPVPLDDWTRWWAWVPGADWRHPDGPGSTLHGMELHPVVHVGLEDATAYADWAGARLPTEAEWEHAARGGLKGATYAWGAEFMPRGRVMANTWHGRFPYENLAPHGYTRTSPVKKFPPNGYGLYDVAGNVWEWTSTRWTDDHTAGVVLRTGECRRRARQVRDEGWLAPVRAVVLPSLPSGRPAGARTAGHHQPPRLPVRPRHLSRGPVHRWVS